MLSRFRECGWSIVSFAALSAALIAGCGGAADSAKTKAVDTAKKPAADAQSSSKADDKKTADTDVKMDKPADKSADKPSVPKERFASPNDEVTPTEDRKKLVFASNELMAEAWLPSVRMFLY